MANFGRGCSNRVSILNFIVFGGWLCSWPRSSDCSRRSDSGITFSPMKGIADSSSCIRYVWQFCWAGKNK